MIFSFALDLSTLLGVSILFEFLHRLFANVQYYCYQDLLSLSAFRHLCLLLPTEIMCSQIDHTLVKEGQMKLPKNGHLDY